MIASAGAPKWRSDDGDDPGEEQENSRGGDRSERASDWFSAGKSCELGRPNLRLL